MQILFLRALRQNETLWLSWQKRWQKMLTTFSTLKKFSEKNLENLIRRYHESFMFEICVGEMGRKTTDKNGSIIFPSVWKSLVISHFTKYHVKNALKIK